MTGRDWDLRGARLAGFQFAEWLVINGGRASNFVDQYGTRGPKSVPNSSMPCRIE